MERYELLELAELVDLEFDSAMERLEKNKSRYSKNEFKRIKNHLGYNFELIRTELNSQNRNPKDQWIALTKAYIAFAFEDWKPCRKALEEFFRLETPESIQKKDPSKWDFNHVCAWKIMLLETGLAFSLENKNARTFERMITKQIIDKHPGNN
jgi:hypothetical protein